VNFSALLSRFSRIWRRRTLSPTTGWGSLEDVIAQRQAFAAAVGATRSRALSMQDARSNGCGSRSIRPASILEKSRMSLMIASSASPLPDRLGVLALLALESVSSSSPLMPMIAFIGVRISWLMVARKVLLASLALSAPGALPPAR
jgi:hypothetical protein